MALDEPEDGDKILDVEGVSFVIEKQLYQIAMPIRIDTVIEGGRTDLSISSTISDNTCPIAEDPGSCRGYCTPSFCEL
ncbi:MAG: hypothetical protein JRI36_11170 [Deltaproteobacteria bacterium]|nr:hypothetical protein [Deltaproteobacteria bacterium]